MAPGAAAVKVGTAIDSFPAGPWRAAEDGGVRRRDRFSFAGCCGLGDRSVLRAVE